MAAREGQGLQIAVIIFAMLTIILAITTYIFYAQYQTTAKEAEAARAAKGQTDTENKKLHYRVAALKRVVGMNVTDADLDLAKSNAGGADEEADQILADLKAHVAQLGSQVAPDQVANYRTIQQMLVSSLQKKNEGIADANAQTRTAQTEKDQAIAAANARATAAEEAAKKATDDLAAQKKTYDDLRAAVEGDKTKLQEQFTSTIAKSKGEIDRISGERDNLIKSNTDLQTTVNQQDSRLTEFENEQQNLFEQPDAKITWVNQKQRLVWLNVGRADGLMRQTTFSIYPHNETGVASAEPKARIEVVAVNGDHIAEAQILEDKASDPILPGDIAHTPTWSPGQRIHFALAGKMDINKDSIDDYDLVRNIILVNGGIIDAELRADGTRTGNMSVNTRYFVLGEPNEAGPYLTQYNTMKKERESFGIDEIQVQKLLGLMGWKTEERTVELNGGRSGQFRKRSPGKAQPATTPAPATETPAPEATTPAAPAEADPFAAPGGADPFATPAADAPAPMPAAPAAEADPFATP